MLLIGLVLSAVTQADRWVHVGGSANLYEEYLDTESVQRRGDKATAWTRRDLVGGQSTLWHEIEFDCSTRMETILAYVRDDGGTVSHNFDRPHRGPAPITAGSTAERVFDIACR